MYNRFLNYLKKIDKYLIYFLYSRLFKKSYVHVVGDSHTHVFKKDNFFLVHHLGPITAFNLHKSKSTTNSNEKLKKIISLINAKKDILILICGEIDCRIHIYKQYRKIGGSLDEYIKKTIYNYDKVLQLCVEKNIKCFVYGAPPASLQENVYGYTFYAPLAVRVYINREYNKQLRQLCLDKNYNFIDIYSHTVDSEGLIKKEYRADDVHLNDKIIPFVIRCVKSLDSK